MKNIVRIAALLFLLALPASVLGHTAVSTGCGSITFNSNPGWTVTVGDLKFGPFTQDVTTEKIAPGTYDYQFYTPAGAKEDAGTVTVAPCATPTPKATPKPHPKATPPATDETDITTPENVQSNADLERFFAATFGLVAVVAALWIYMDHKRA